MAKRRFFSSGLARREAHLTERDRLWKAYSAKRVRLGRALAAAARTPAQEVAADRKPALEPATPTTPAPTPDLLRSKVYLRPKGEVALGLLGHVHTRR